MGTLYVSTVFSAPPRQSEMTGITDPLPSLQVGALPPGGGGCGGCNQVDIGKYLMILRKGFIHIYIYPGMG